MLSESQRENINPLYGELWGLFLKARGSMASSGLLPGIRRCAAKQKQELLDGAEVEAGPRDIAKACECREEESCPQCEIPDDLTSIEEVCSALEEAGPFDSMAEKLVKVKRSEFIALAEKAYAPVGDKPFQLKSDKALELPEEQVKEAAQAFYDYLEGFLEENDVRQPDILDAFDLTTLEDLADQLTDTIRADVADRLQRDLSSAENILARVFKRARFMQEYRQLFSDIAQYPIAGIWCDDAVRMRDRSFLGGKLVVSSEVQTDAWRIDPTRLWLTNDWKAREEGRAVFVLKKMGREDIAQLRPGSPLLEASRDDFLTDIKEGFTLPATALFFNELGTDDRVDFDVLVTRGQYRKEHVERLGIKVDDAYSDRDFIPVEVYFSADRLLQVRVLDPAYEDLGVYFTHFRSEGDSVFGMALDEFVRPFAKLYEGTLKGLDISVGKSTGSFTAIDVGVIEDPTQFMKRNKQGEVELDLSGDNLIQFDSTEAMNPNFKGVPLHVSQMPSNLGALVPVLSLVFEQLERITGIPALLTQTGGVSSALRTEKIFNQAYESASQGVQALLRGTEERVLEKAIRFFFYMKASAGEFPQNFLEADPEILLTDELTREFNDDRRLLQNAQEILAVAQNLPQTEVDALVNQLGREVYGYNHDLIGSSNPLQSSPQAVPASVAPNPATAP